MLNFSHSTGSGSPFHFSGDSGRESCSVKIPKSMVEKHNTNTIIKALAQHSSTHQTVHTTDRPVQFSTTKNRSCKTNTNQTLPRGWCYFYCHYVLHIQLPISIAQVHRRLLQCACSILKQRWWICGPNKRLQSWDSYRRFGHLSTIFPTHFKPKPHLQYSIFSKFLRSNWVTHQNTYFDRMNFWFSILLLSITWFYSKSIWFLFETHNHISSTLTPESTCSHINKFTVKFSEKTHM